MAEPQKHILQVPRDRDPTKLLNSERGRSILAKGLFLSLRHQSKMPGGELTPAEAEDMEFLLLGCYESHARLLSQRFKDPK